MLVLKDTACLKHETVELLGAKTISALESPRRLESIYAALEGGTHVQRERNTFLTEAKECDRATVLLCEVLRESHHEGYIEHLRTAHQRWVQRGLITEDESILPECFHVPSKAAMLSGKALPPPKDVFAQTGYYAFDMSTGIGKDTWLAAWASALIALDGACMLAESSPDAPLDVLALCRPPGHHCTTSQAGGYCYINNAIVAVHAFRKCHTGPTTPRIAILDIDFHHGNGTQDYFYEDPSVLYVSIHGQDEYPYYTGAETEKGYGDGIGFNYNFPLPAGASVDAYLAQLTRAVNCIAEFDPDYLVISLGFDTFNTDPLGSFKIETEDYATIASTVRQRRSLVSVPSLILLEGGYVVEHLGKNMVSFLKGWENPP